MSRGMGRGICLIHTKPFQVHYIEEAGSIQTETEQTIPALDYFVEICSKKLVSLVMSIAENTHALRACYLRTLWYDELRS